MRFKLGWIGYCEYNHKVWVWFTDSQQELTRYSSFTRYCIWGVIHKKLSINSHYLIPNPSVNDIRRKKEQNGYKSITIDELLIMWPDFYNELERKFIWAKLSDQI